VTCLLGTMLVATGCSGDPQAESEPDPVDTGCEPGELPLAEGTGCRAAGIAAEQCAEGFASDGLGGCDPLLPATPCEPGTMATPGDSECRAVAPCGDGPWGDIDIADDTQLVDGSYAGGGSDGTADRPWTTIGEAIAAANPGATVAVAAGSYTGDVLIAAKPIVLWGRCPAMVEIVGNTTGSGMAAVTILGGAAGAIVRGVAVTGPAFGIASSGSTDVVVEGVWVHDTLRRGVVTEGAYGVGSLTVTGSLVESASDIGVMAYGVPLVLEHSVVRGTMAGGGSGRGVVARHGATIAIRSSVIAGNRDHGMVFGGATAEVDASVVRDTLPDSRGEFGGGILVQKDSDTQEPAVVTVTGSVLVGNHTYGIHVEGAELVVERTVVRDTLPQPSDSGFGVGIQGQPDRGAAIVRVVDSLIERNYYGGVAVMGSFGHIESTIVRDTMPRPIEQDFGRGVLVFHDLALGMDATATVLGSVIERNTEAGIFVAAADIDVDSCAVRDTAPRLSDGRIGRGICVQSQDTHFFPSHAHIANTLVERNHEIGVFVEGSEATLEGCTVRDTREQVAEGTFGDNVTAMTWTDAGQQARVTVSGCSVEVGPRAGIANFGSEVTIRDSQLDCNGIDLNGQDSTVAAFTFLDDGGNQCGCGEDAGCQVLTNDLVPPDPLM
jgi:hypothetical protein